jgi:nitroreductase
MSEFPDALAFRKPDHPIERLFLARWSQRAMNGAPLAEQELLSLLEAARWAPSTFNEQEWRYLYARRDTPSWELYLDLLVPGNKAWCHRAAVLFVLLSKRTFTRNGKPNPVHSFDAGASFENLALQGAAMGLVVHAMAGFDRVEARRALEIPDDHEIEAMVAAGRPGDPADLPPELRARERPSGRKPVSEFAREGRFSF